MSIIEKIIVWKTNELDFIGKNFINFINFSNFITF